MPRIVKPHCRDMLPLPDPCTTPRQRGLADEENSTSIIAFRAPVAEIGFSEDHTSDGMFWPPPCRMTSTIITVSTCHLISLSLTTSSGCLVKFIF
ncbi:hypothetical protein PanWU01x14_077250, partial [Parasponia andersonii]